VEAVTEVVVEAVTEVVVTVVEVTVVEVTEEEAIEISVQVAAEAAAGTLVIGIRPIGGLSQPFAQRTQTVSQGRAVRPASVFSLKTSFLMRINEILIRN
jgi:hypothetical protein